MQDRGAGLGVCQCSTAQRRTRGFRLVGRGGCVSWGGGVGRAGAACMMILLLLLLLY